MKFLLPAGASRYISVLSIAAVCLAAITFALVSNGVDTYPPDAMFWEIVAQSVGIKGISQELYTPVVNFRVLTVLRIVYLFFAGACFALAALLLEDEKDRYNRTDAVLLVSSLTVLVARFALSADGVQSFPIIQSGTVLLFTVAIALSLVVMLTRFRSVLLWVSSSVIPIILAVFIIRILLYRESPLFFDLFMGDGLYRAMLFLPDQHFVNRFVVPLFVCLVFLLFQRFFFSGRLSFPVKAGLATIISVLAIGITGPLWILGTLSVWCARRIFPSIQDLPLFSCMLVCTTAGSFVVACDALSRTFLCWELPLGASLLFLFGPALMLSKSGWSRQDKGIAVVMGLVLFAAPLLFSLFATNPVEATEAITVKKLNKRKNFLFNPDISEPPVQRKIATACSKDVQHSTIASITTPISVEELSAFILHAARDGVDLIVLPAPSEIFSDETAKNVLEKLSVTAKENRVGIICSFVTNAGEKLRAITYGIDKNGKIVGHYQKSHGLPNESFELGDKLPVLHIDGIAVGILIGSDIYFSEIEHTLLRRGANVIIWQLERPLPGFSEQQYLKRLLEGRSQANCLIGYVVSGFNLRKNQGGDKGGFENSGIKSIAFSKVAIRGHAIGYQTITAKEKRLKEFSYPALYGNKPSMLNTEEKTPLRFRIAVLNTLPSVEIMRGIVVGGHRGVDIFITSENIYCEKKSFPTIKKNAPQSARMLHRSANLELLQASRMARRFRVNVFITNGYNQMRTAFLNRSGEVKDVYLKGETTQHGWVTDPDVFIVDRARFGGHICADSVSWEKSMDQYLQGVDMIVNPAGGIGDMNNYNLPSMNGFGFRVIASPTAPPRTGCLASNHLGEFFFDSRKKPCLGRSPGIFDIDLNPLVEFAGKQITLRSARRIIFTARRPELYRYREGWNE